jgi:hypothetical protein
MLETASVCKANSSRRAPIKLVFLFLTAMNSAGFFFAMARPSVPHEILSGRRSISKAQAKRLAEFFRVPIDLFI